MKNRTKSDLLFDKMISDSNIVVNSIINGVNFEKLSDNKISDKWILSKVLRLFKL